MAFVRFFGLALVLAGGSVACGGSIVTISDDGGPSAKDAGSDTAPPEDGGHVRIPVKHRPSADACSADRAPGNGSGGHGPPTIDGGGGGCASDADCTQGKNGRCSFSSWGLASCSYDECFADSDCSAGWACECGETSGGTRSAANQCMRGNCRIDSDCGVHGFCSPTLEMNSCAVAPGGYFCHTPKDKCIDDADCQPIEKCNYDLAGGNWACVPITVCAG